MFIVPVIVTIVTVGNNTITPLLGWHISSNVTRFPCVITVIIKLDMLELQLK